MRASPQVLRISPQGKQRRIYVKRRDLLRSNGLLPRDLRRIDPTLSVTKTSPAISIKEHVLLVNLGGVRCAWSSHERPVPCLLGDCTCGQMKGLRVYGVNARYGKTCFMPTLSNALPCVSIYMPCAGQYNVATMSHGTAVLTRRLIPVCWLLSG